jgi:hypothetical protein
MKTAGKVKAPRIQSSSGNPVNIEFAGFFIVRFHCAPAARAFFGKTPTART